MTGMMWKAVMQVLKQQRGMVLGCINPQRVHGIRVSTVYLSFSNINNSCINSSEFSDNEESINQMKIPKMPLRRTVKTAKQWITLHLDLQNMLKIFFGYTTMQLNRATNAKLVKCFLRGSRSSQ